MGAGRKALIVDDEAHNLSLLDRILKKTFETTAASDASEARQLLQDQTFDLIISDQRMPGETGLELLQHAAVIQPAATRILATAFVDCNEIRTAIESEIVHGLLEKPVDLDAITVVLERRLASCGSSTAAKGSLR